MNRIPQSARWLALVLSLAAIGACFFFTGQQGPETGPLARYGLRLAIVVFALVAWYLSQSLISSRGMKEGPIADAVHDLTAPWHAYLQAHPRTADAVLVVSSAFIDLLGLFLIAASVFGPSVRPLAALIVLFAMRQVCQGVCALPTPPGMIWRFPGVPSILVTYDVANDFFFSGHTSIAVLAAVEAAAMFPLWAGILVALIALLEAGVVLVLRAHYTMDVVAAVFAAFCAAGLADWLCPAW
jgi:hypothetical protein